MYHFVSIKSYRFLKYSILYLATSIQKYFLHAAIQSKNLTQLLKTLQLINYISKKQKFF